MSWMFLFVVLCEFLRFASRLKIRRMNKPLSARNCFRPGDNLEYFVCHFSVPQELTLDALLLLSSASFASPLVTRPAARPPPHLHKPESARLLSVWKQKLASASHPPPGLQNKFRHLLENPFQKSPLGNFCTTSKSYGAGKTARATRF